MTDMESFSDLARERRSTRRFAPGELGQEEVVALLGAALQAPSSKNSRCWQFVAVDDEGLLQRLSRCKERGASFLADAALAVVVLAAAVLGFRKYAMGVQLTIPTEDIAAVTLEEDNSLRVTMQDGKCWTGLTASYRTLRTGGEEKEIVLFTLYVDLWSSLFQDGWSDGEEAMLFNDLLDGTEAVCYVRWDEWEQVDAATKTEGEGAAARDIIDGDAVPGLLHTMWQR